MRLFLGLSFLVAACTRPSSPSPEADPTDEVLRRLDDIENRLKALESRPGKTATRATTNRSKTRPSDRAARGGKDTKAKTAPPVPLVTVALEGDADRVALSGQERTWRLPRRVPAGDYWLLVAFGEEKLERHLQITLTDIDQRVRCDASTKRCEVFASSPTPSSP